MKLAAILVGLAVLAVAGAAAFVWSGIYNVSAIDQHLPPTHFILQKAMQRSVERRAKQVEVPPLGDPEQIARGIALYRMHCVQCHGAPGVAPQPFALGMRPLATPLARTGRDQPPAHVYWVLRNGLKMTAMPAFEFRMDDQDLWAIVAFVMRLPMLTPAEYQRLAAASPPRAAVPAALRDPDAARGKRALEQYACVACHQIPGLVGPEARLGPTLHGIGSRGTLGGVLANTPENMVRWLRSPQSVAPLSAMPDLGVTEQDARDIAAHLQTFR
jgi:mono/diheme cytochrome c family protein